MTVQHQKFLVYLCLTFIVFNYAPKLNLQILVSKDFGFCFPYIFHVENLSHPFFTEDLWSFQPAGKFDTSNFQRIIVMEKRNQLMKFFRMQNKALFKININSF